MHETKRRFKWFRTFLGSLKSHNSLSSEWISSCKRDLLALMLWNPSGTSNSLFRRRRWLEMWSGTGGISTYFSDSSEVKELVAHASLSISGAIILQYISQSLLVERAFSANDVSLYEYNLVYLFHSTCSHKNSWTVSRLYGCLACQNIQKWYTRWYWSYDTTANSDTLGFTDTICEHRYRIDTASTTFWDTRSHLMIQNTKIYFWID